MARSVDAARILVRLPNWVGDCVMATPALGRLRRRFADAHIALAGTPYVRQVVDDGPWADEIIDVPREKGLLSVLRAAARLRQGRFDLGVLLTNSFGSALAARLAGVPRLIGYARDGRGRLLAERLRAPRERGRYLPAPMVEYYGRIADALDCPPGDGRLTLSTAAADEDRAAASFADLGIDLAKPLAGLNPGAAFGSAKCWPPENFARVGDALVDRLGMQVIVLCGPNERDIARRIVGLMHRPAQSVADYDVPLGLLKAIVRRLNLMVTNDSGPQHFAAAFNVPMVTLIGPTNPEWSDTAYDKGVQLRVPVDCGPCMKRRCTRDHRCMTLITPEMVVAAVETLVGPNAGRTE